MIKSIACLHCSFKTTSFPPFHSSASTRKYIKYIIGDHFSFSSLALVTTVVLLDICIRFLIPIVRLVNHVGRRFPHTLIQVSISKSQEGEWSQSQNISDTAQIETNMSSTSHRQTDQLSTSNSGLMFSH